MAGLAWINRAVSAGAKLLMCTEVALEKFVSSRRTIEQLCLLSAMSGEPDILLVLWSKRVHNPCAFRAAAPVNIT